MILKENLYLQLFYLQMVELNILQMNEFVGQERNLIKLLILKKFFMLIIMKPVELVGLSKNRAKIHLLLMELYIIIEMDLILI